MKLLEFMQQLPDILAEKEITSQESLDLELTLEDGDTPVTEVTVRLGKLVFR